MHKLIDDLKRIARIIPILRDEKNKLQRERLGQLALDELQKLTDDLDELKGNSLPDFIIDGQCDKQDEVICNLGYACDACPYNRENLKIKNPKNE